MRAVLIGASLAFASLSLADPLEHVEKVISKAFLPAVATPQHASHMFVRHGVPVAPADRVSIANFPVSNFEISLPQLRGEVFKLEETNDRMKAALEGLQSQIAIMEGHRAEATQVDFQKWRNIIHSSGCLGYSIGAAFFLLIIYKFFLHRIHPAPVLSISPVDGAELQSAAATSLPLLSSCRGLRTAGVVMSEGKSFDGSEALYDPEPVEAGNRCQDVKMSARAVDSSDRSRGLAIASELADRTLSVLPGSSSTTSLKTSVLEKLKPYGDPALNVPREVFDAVDKDCRRLEAQNPTRVEDCIAALEGTWQVRYSNAPPPSNGALGPLRGRGFQIVDVESCTYTNELSLFDGAVRLSLDADFTQPEPEEAALRVAFRTLTVTLFGSVALPSLSFPAGTERTWLLTYSDADTRLVRAGVDGGRSTVRDLGLIKKGEGEAKDAYLFVLTRAAPEQNAAPFSLANPFADTAKRRTLKAELMAACEQQTPGAEEETGRIERIEALMDELAVLNPTKDPAAAAGLCGVWDVAWTTETELNALRRSGFLGLPCLGSSQAIERSRNSGGAFEYTLSNEIAFDGGFLRVGSTCEPDASGGRVNFRFQSCAAKWRFLEFPLPPVGSGWFDVIYLDDELRLCKDVRGDLQVCTRRPRSS